jgi:micrococcal nuclease
LIAASLVYFGVKAVTPGKPVPSASEKGGYFFVERAVDGDTLKLSNGDRVRLIGVDTPELHESEKLAKDASRSHKDASVIKGLGKKAADFTSRLVQGKRVRLEYDVKKHDRYGRILGYLYLEDGTFVNAKIIEEGYAQVMTIPPNVKYADYFLKLQKEARQNGKGLWKTDDFNALK